MIDRQIKLEHGQHKTSGRPGFTTDSFFSTASGVLAETNICELVPLAEVGASIKDELAESFKELVRLSRASINLIFSCIIFNS
jgi:hypothetical protein